MQQEIHQHIENTTKAATDIAHIRAILEKAKECALLKKVNPENEYVQGLNLQETATLLNIDSTNKDLMDELFETALTIKRAIYGNRIVLFAPLYISNWCQCSCKYCSFRATNKDIKRSILSAEEIAAEVAAIERQGHKRILLLTGQHPKYTFDDFLDALQVAAAVKTDPHGEIRRINVEIFSLTVEQFRRLKATDLVGTYALFQETYHRPTFKQMHPWGPKSDYDFRYTTMDRALQAGMDDVGIGALFGLYDYRFEVLGLLKHAQHLDATYGVGPHTISIPRLQPAYNTPTAMQPPAPVSDADFKKLTAVIRCAVPYTGMILTTRESPKMRRELYNLGVSQISAGSKTTPGGYQQKGSPDAAQFSLSDNRPASEVIRELIELGFTPSWCTACYRLNRTGKAFMKIAKQGKIQDCCHPNALLTLSEYLHDYADDETRQMGQELIEKGKKTISSPKRLKDFEEKLLMIENGSRDLYF